MMLAILIFPTLLYISFAYENTYGKIQEGDQISTFGIEGAHIPAKMISNVCTCTCCCNLDKICKPVLSPIPTVSPTFLPTSTPTQSPTSLPTFTTTAPTTVTVTEAPTSTSTQSPTSAPTSGNSNRSTYFDLYSQSNFFIYLHDFFSDNRYLGTIYISNLCSFRSPIR